MKNLKKTLAMFGFITGFILAVNFSATAQTRVAFAKGALEKTITVTLPANGTKSFVLAVNKKQAINVNALTSQNLLDLSFSLVNASRSDNFEDYEGGLTVLTGRKGDYTFSVSNNSKKSRTFKMKVRVGVAGEYEGGVTETKAKTESLTESSDSTNTTTNLKALAMKYIPNGAEIIHKIVQGKFAPAGVKSNADNVVVIYRDKSGSKFGEYNTMVLVPKGASWEKYVLPQPDATWSFMKPLAVFFENVDKDSDMELIIVEEAESGAGPDGAKPFYRTRVYDWSGSRFVHREDISDKISADADTVAKVRKQLKRIVR